MARTQPVETVKKVLIRIEDSLTTYGSGYGISANLRQVSNLVRNYIRQDGRGEAPFGFPAVPFDGTILLFPTAQGADGMGVWLGDVSGTHLLVGAQQVAPPRGRVYNLTDGMGITSIDWGGVISGPWSFAFAPNIDRPTTYVTYQGATRAIRLRETFDGSGMLVGDLYNPTFNPNGQTGFEVGPSLLYYHINRLFLLYRSTFGRRSLVFFSDASDPQTIRGTNFIDVADLGTAMFRSSASDLDVSEQANLFIAGESTISILEGDPTLGNATFRVLKKNFGITSSRQIVETSEGACFLATDGMIYIIPRGSLEPIPISPRVRNIVDRFTSNLFFGFRKPYLYVFNGAEAKPGFYLADLSNLQDVYWSGPHTARNDVPYGGGMISDNPFLPSSSYTTTAFGINNLGSISSLIIDDNNINFGTQLLETGYISEPDADVQFKRSVLVFQNAGTNQHFRLTLKDSEGRTDFVDFVVPASLPIKDRTTDVLVVFPVALGGEFFFLKLESLDPILGQMKNLRSWLLEYRVDPRKV